MLSSQNYEYGGKSLVDSSEGGGLVGDSSRNAADFPPRFSHHVSAESIVSGFAPHHAMEMRKRSEGIITTSNDLPKPDISVEVKTFSSNGAASIKSGAHYTPSKSSTKGKEDQQFTTILKEAKDNQSVEDEKS